MPAAERLAMSDHLAACPDCRAMLDRRTAADLPLAVGAPPTVEYEALAAYLDGTLDPVDREIFEADLQNHPSLAVPLEDLQKFRVEQQIATHTNVAVKVKDSPSDAVSNVRPFPNWLRQPAIWIPLATAALVMLSITGVHRWRTPGDGGAAWIQDGDTRVDARSLAALPGLPETLRGAVRTAATGGGLPPLACVRELAGTSGVLLGEASPPDARGGFRMLEPVGRVTRETQPTLCWTKQPGAAAYRATLASGAETEPMTSPNLPATSQDTQTWLVPMELARGSTYEWQVQALDHDGKVLVQTPLPPQPEARFRVLDAPAEVEIAQLENRRPRYHLVLAAAYLRHGLIAEARREVHALAEANPGSPLVQRWQREVGGTVAGE